MQNGYAVETKNLTKTFGHFTALDKLNLKIESHAIHGLLGPNGAGKTTGHQVALRPPQADQRRGVCPRKKVPDRSLLPQIATCLRRPPSIRT